ncbi:MAG TPA: c-type cytochrome biogenesis protein CcmI [Burkholderiales bacterium]|nr:c-type cytochrome biogenesis protein CcmI [Burkholderiales bacterium]
MTFWVIAALLAAGALAFVLPPLLGRRRAGGATADETNVALYRDQLKELDADLAAGTLNAARHEEARHEIERRLIEDVRAAAVPAASASGRNMAIAVGVAVPLAAILLYLAVGNPQALAPEAATGDAPTITRAQIEGMVERLAARMKETPDDVKGWVMLGRSYAVLDRYPESVAAYANAVKRSPPDAQLLADYADALAMSRGRNLQGEPERLIARALKVDPNNVKALMLAGTAALERKNFKGAIAYWERILKVVPPDSDIADAVRDGIADARALAGAPKAPPPKTAMKSAPAGVGGTVRLAPALASKAAPSDTVFIFARPVDGPRMPLAVQRKQVRDLPAQFALDDSMAMTPAAMLSNHAQVVIGARISKSGNPVAQPGDLEGFSAPAKVGSTSVAVTIDREVTAPK